MKLSNQALGALMMALQRSLMEQADIVPILENFEFNADADGRLFVRNPPTLKIDAASNLNADHAACENNSTVGSD